MTTTATTTKQQQIYFVLLKKATIIFAGCGNESINDGYSDKEVSGPGGRVLPTMAYMGRLRPKGEPFSGFRYIKG